MNRSSYNRGIKPIKIVYLHRHPELHPRTDKIRQTLIRNGFSFEVFAPRVNIKTKNRIVSAIINYSCFFLQSLSIKGDIIWVANCPDIVGLGLCLSSKKYIYDYRSPWSKEVELEFGNKIFSGIARIIEKIVRNRAMGLILVSSTMRKDVEHLNKPTFVIPNYPTKNFSPTKERDSIRKSIGLNNDRHVVLFVGKLSKLEGADMLLHIVEGLDPSKNLELWIVGDGPLRGEIEYLQQKYPDRVRYFGWVNYEEVPNYIVAADICIVPRHNNPFSEYYNEQGVQKISEYLALGKPVVACNISKSDTYILVDENHFAEGILNALTNSVILGEKRLWEDHSEPILIQAVNTFLSYDQKDNEEIRKYSSVGLGT